MFYKDYFLHNFKISYKITYFRPNFIYEKNICLIPVKLIIFLYILFGNIKQSYYLCNQKNLIKLCQREGETSSDRASP